LPGTRGRAVRRRLALKAAAASARIARRGEDEATLRDVFFLRHGGDDPGPAGRMLVAWRGLDRSAPLGDESGNASGHFSRNTASCCGIPSSRDLARSDM